MAANDLPSNISYGTVKGRFLLAYADGVDSDVFPDGAPAKGSILFTPSPANIKDTTAVANSVLTPVTILPGTIACELDSEGYLLGTDGTRGVRLVATDDPDMNPTNWTWQVDYRLTDQDGAAVRGVPTHDMSLPSGTTVDLTQVAPVASSDGTYYIVGPQGLQGVRGRYFTSDTPPTFTEEDELYPLVEGDAWFNVNTGKLYIYYDAFWIEAYSNIAGLQGPQGIQGEPGVDGQGVNLTVGTVTSVPSGDGAEVSITGTFPNQTINFVLEAGETGPAGADGPIGPPGPEANIDDFKVIQILGAY